jgi:cytochrome c556
MKRIALIALSSFMIAASSFSNAAEPQELRQAAMKKVGGAIGLLSTMAKGEAPFDAAAAQAAFATMNAVSKEYVSLFPVGSETGFETEASPDIWANMDDFKAKVAKFDADTAAAAGMTFADAAGVGAAIGSVAENCGACHKLYRVKK